MNTGETGKQKNISYPLIWVEGFFGIAVVLAVIFLLAGRVSYWQGWAFGGAIFITAFLPSVLFFRGKTGLAQERIKPGPGIKWWDRVFYGFYIPSYVAIVVIASLDAGRFGWTAHFPFYGYVIGYILFMLAVFITLWATWINRFFSSVVRIQKERGQEVIQDGPYRFVRHPGYVGGILLALGNALILGSLWALIPAGVMSLLLVIRTYLEDITLQRELPGYTDYIRKVKYRLLPWIW